MSRREFPGKCLSCKEDFESFPITQKKSPDGILGHDMWTNGLCDECAKVVTWESIQTISIEYNKNK